MRGGGGGGVVDVTRQTDVPLYYPASSSSPPRVLETRREIDDFPIGVLSSKCVNRSSWLVNGVCARARAGRGNANNGPANCEAPNLALAANGYATLHYPPQKRERTHVYLHLHECRLTWACARALLRAHTHIYSGDGGMLVSTCWLSFTNSAFNWM